MALTDTATKQMLCALFLIEKKTDPRYWLSHILHTGNESEP